MARPSEDFCHGFEELTEAERSKTRIYGDLIGDLSSSSPDKSDSGTVRHEILVSLTDHTSGATDHSPPFQGFGSDIQIPGRVEIVEMDGDVEMVRKKRLGKPRGLDLRQSKSEELEKTSRCLGSRSGHVRALPVSGENLPSAPSATSTNP